MPCSIWLPAGDFVLLPPELLHQIISHLPLSAAIALKLVNKALFRAVRLPSDTLSRDSRYKLPYCEQDAIRRNINEYWVMKSCRRRCAVCDSVQHLRDFPESSAACHFHDERLTMGVEEHFSKPWDELLATAEGSMVVSKRPFCMHKRELVPQDASNCSCGCPSCAHPEVVCFSRAGDLAFV
ncbi:hypothetical protein BAUCODRAFT_22469 [Baudoinia panamericana UAMH 10762]|uniref:F-box domain-containing protein n=1 Tax=Baudoinia panamericana (strain UAMH 10762) TaxID=717646 RepID=M2NJ89_BAUPA|nr:uncharacterized protein BAUCODRAFT_22469 [Baudoinia panamericana UAMH 10762]EMC99200.1 hypothetical protein BAUCODRAFT_22469 [Baudoinia panamericana UAMH 10762]